MPNNFEQAAYVLFNALQNDPFFSAIVADLPIESPERIERLVPYYLYSLQEGERLGTTLVLEPDPVGAAIWWFPQDDDLQYKMQRKKHTFLGELFGKSGLAQYEAITGFMHRMALPVIPLTGWYLSIAGISPHLQRRGLGEKLLRPTLIEADTARVTCYLETFNPESLPFYRKMGFDQVTSHLEPVTKSTYWIMLREPKKV